MRYFVKIDKDSFVCDIVDEAYIEKDDYYFFVEILENTKIGKKSFIGIDYKKENIDPNFEATQIIGFFYDSNTETFIPPKPFENWKFNYETLFWEAPISAPDDGGLYTWDEEENVWINIPNIERPSYEKYYEWDVDTQQWVH